MSSIGVKRPVSELTCSSNVLSAKKSDVPEYLRAGAFYIALAAEDDRVFEVPNDVMKLDKSISNSDDLIYLLKSLRFWGVDGVVPEIVDLALSDTCMEAMQQIIATFEQDFPYLATLNTILLNESKDTTKSQLIVASGNLDLVKYHHNKYGCLDWDGDLTAEAARHGHLHCLQFLHQHSYPFHKDIVGAAIVGGNMDCLRFVNAQDPDCFKPAHSYVTVCEQSISSRSLESFVYCVQNGAVFIPSLIADAFLHNGLESARYCMQQGVPCNEAVMSAAIWQGRLDCVEYLHAQGCAFPDNATNDAALRGHLEILKYLHEHGAIWSTETTKIASTIRRLEILKYLHEQGCPWDYTAYSTNEANKECNEYLEQNGYSRERPDMAGINRHQRLRAALGVTGARKVSVPRSVRK